MIYPKSEFIGFKFFQIVIFKFDHIFKCIFGISFRRTVSHLYILDLWNHFFVDLLFIKFIFRGFVHLGAGLSVGFSGLAAGFAIGIVGDAGVRGTAQQPRLFVGMILILIFAEVLGLYGLIVAIFLYTKS